ncbi:MAG: transcriptional repressor [Desulfurococcales archaeon]|nr:transcriptional repressor [Desulfurococcales archaeon]
MAEVRGAEKVSIEEVIRLLNRLNLRITPQRIIITKIILENVKNHPSFKQIYELVRKEMPSIGVSTLFNTLKLLEKHNIVTLFELNGETHIDLPRPHVNIYCTNTGKIVDYESEDTSKIIEDLLATISRAGVKPYRVNVVVEASCPEVETN